MPSSSAPPPPLVLFVPNPNRGSREGREQTPEGEGGVQGGQRTQPRFVREEPGLSGHITRVPAYGPAPASPGARARSQGAITETQEDDFVNDSVLSGERESAQDLRTQIKAGVGFCVPGRPPRLCGELAQGSPPRLASTPLSAWLQPLTRGCGPRGQVAFARAASWTLWSSVET